LNAVKFSPNRRIQLREGARKDLGLSDNEFAILLIGNDWRKKGLQCLLEAVARLGDSRFRILVVGQDSSSVYRKQLAPLGLDKQVQFLPPRSDVEFYYAAADVYAGPSLEDTFSLPPAEAMACGLAVITTRAAGVSEIIHHGEDGLVMEDPYDVETLSNWLGQLSRDEHWSRELGDAARKTAEQYTWERNAREMGEVLRSIVEERSAL
jgi:glycosyltransferase involved in cell wall biosynthesis